MKLVIPLESIEFRFRTRFEEKKLFIGRKFIISLAIHRVMIFQDSVCFFVPII